MQHRSFCLLVVALGSVHAGFEARAKEKNPESWAWISCQAVEVRPAPSVRKRPLAHLNRGALVGVYQSVSKGNVGWSQIRVVDLEKLEARLGWVDSSQIEHVPLEEFPPDADLLKMLGGVYLDDFTNSHIQIARFVIHQGGAGPALLCFLGSAVLAQSRLQVFRRTQAEFAAGPFLEFLFSEMKAGITALEIQDLIGDGNECLVTHEPFDLGPENRGVKLTIRRIEAAGFRTLWEAPLEYRHLDSFPPQYHALEPKERNIGAAGTITKGSVEFRSRGRLSEPVWRGKVEFHVVGRMEPVESAEIEKVCSWDGTKFTPLR